MDEVVRFELRTVDRGGGGPREAERLVRGRVAGIFQTEVGEAGQTILISPLGAEPVNDVERREGRFGSPELPGRIEVLKATPFMRPWTASELGRVWELSWFDYQPGVITDVVKEFGEALSAWGALYPVVGCWSVDVGANADRIYVLAPFKDWDHRDEVAAKLRDGHVWPPLTTSPAKARGCKLLLPAGNSAMR